MQKISFSFITVVFKLQYTNKIAMEMHKKQVNSMILMDTLAKDSFFDIFLIIILLCADFPSFTLKYTNAFCANRLNISEENLEID